MERVEAALGVMLAGVLAGVCGLATIAIAAQILYDFRNMQPLWQPLAVLGGAAVVTVLASKMLMRLADSFDRRSPQLTYHMARSFARPGLLLRVPLGLIALAMAIGVLTLGQLWVLLFDVPNPSTGGRVFLFLATLTVLFGAAYASNAYFLCALRAFFVPRRVVHFVYRSRYLIDCGLALGLTAITERFLNN